MTFLFRSLALVSTPQRFAPLLRTPTLSASLFSQFRCADAGRHFRGVSRPPSATCGLTRSYATAVTRIPAKTHIRALVFNEYGDYQEKDFAKSDLLPARDMRSIDPSFRSQMPTMFVRDGAIVVNLEHIRAIIRHDSVLLFDYTHPSVQSFIPVMSKALKDTTMTPGVYSPYEFRALEAILTNVCAFMQRQLQTLTPAVIDVLDNLARDINVPSLERLLPLNKSLTSFDVSVNEVKEAIAAILNSNNDMAGMYLTIRAQTGCARLVDQHDEMEMMLETYLQQVDEIVNDVAQLRMTVQSTQDYINLTLNSTRNQIIRLDLVLTVATLSVSSAALISSVFGMNLLNHFEAHPESFYYVTSGVAVAGAAIFASMYRVLRLKRIV